ncbi:ABC transporter substrate-binding protein [Paracoccus shanxieyensis]|uniref:ABC transporter substrate-binding protein n=1 Tax=Paracoccus shanxieyensis TaxID=2675752 RepID=A0A6L6J1G8_9RHOB|nr:ABC transporter substrate-binding protein [Paracoccus shanxieyensis]MTH65658.1 ABC transporter substrate-binding protein [Paracoccus shanxieyensis]MTH88767.1 ABC transporter substrate-binding protein [Paracoccus shanxieyensis]
MFQRLAASIALGLALTGTALAETDIRFTLGWKTQGSDAPMLLALSKGYFKDEGLNVTIDQGEGSGATVTRIMSGTYDAGFGDINAIIQNAATRPEETPVMVYQMWSVPPFAISSRKETGITTPADLLGKTLGGAQGTPTTRLVTVLARKNGIDPAQLQITNLAPNLQEPMLIKGDIDGALVFNITGWFNLINNRQDPEADYNWLNFGDFGLDLYSNGVMVSRKLIAENPDAVRGLVRAINRAAIEIGTDLDAGAASITAYDNLAKADLERDRMIFAYERLMQSPESQRIGLGDLDDARLTRAIDIVAEGYELPAKPEASAVFTRDFLPPQEERTLVYTAE